MGLKEDKIVPGREERVAACMAFGGCASGIGKQDKICLKNNERGFSQAGLCQLLPTLGMLLTLPETAVIVHGAIGCGSTGFGMNTSIRLHHLLRGNPNAKDSLWFSTNLDESDVVHGGEQRLEETILAVNEKYKPKSIIVMHTCTPSIIGDDLVGVIEKVRPLIDTSLLYSHCEGFKTKVWATGYDVAFHAMVHGFIEKDKDGPPPKKEGRKPGERPIVNVINLASMGKPDEVELERLLNAIGIDVVIGPNFADRETIRRMTQADLTVSVCPTHDDYLVHYLNTEYGIPCVLKDMPIGLENTRRWLLDIAGNFGLENEALALIEAEEAKVKKGVEKYLPALKGIKVFLSAGEFRALVTGGLFQELGMEIVGLRSYHHDDFGTEFYDRLIEAQKGKDFPIDIANFQPFELVNLLKKVDPDLFCGHVFDNAWAARLGYPTITIFRIFDHYVGYRGFYEVAKKAVRNLRNHAFNAKLSQNVPEAYRKEWYEKSPFAYIKSEAA
ncbi:nitrogenase component 1 [Geotalea sp. SG265]|uniref:nitrogenase component 1 n=1 Tax=Geotalea sp. SG265 TaxID=2922867 RepID=UPI001FAF5110|nr:nitrogenase component 1 [Geotalea sp. SG265]